MKNITELDGAEFDCRKLNFKNMKTEFQRLLANSRLHQWRGLGLSENGSDYFFSFFHVFSFKLFGIFVFISERKPPLVQAAKR